MEKLNKALVKVQSELKAPKGQYNSFGKYAYRSAEDILEAVKPLLAKNGLSMRITDEVIAVGSEVFINSTAVVTDGVDSIYASAQAGIDPNRKGMDIAQSYGSSSSYARKYALNGMFLIDDTKDADATNTHGKVSQSTKAPAPAASKNNSSSNAFTQSIDYIKAAKNKKQALAQILNKYGETFSDKQKEALGKFVK
jgi:nitric oxide reductase large subunit